MKLIAILILLIVIPVTFAGQERSTSSPEEVAYPNEVLSLKLYHSAQWKAIEPYISTEADVRKALGQPTQVFVWNWSSGVHWSYSVLGYDIDPDWTIVISYWGRMGCCIPKTLIGRVHDVTLYPKRQVSMKDVVFSSAFKSNGVFVDMGDGRPQVITYRDDFGLSYSIYHEDTSDGLFHAGDLKSITYGASQETDLKLRGSK